MPAQGGGGGGEAAACRDVALSPETLATSAADRRVAIRRARMAQYADDGLV